MIYNFKYSNYNNSGRQEILNYVKSKKYKRVIDIGATANGWSREIITHYVDINLWNVSDVKGFNGSLCFYSTWEKILKDVEENGKYDFCICSHTLEDISCPQLTCEMINKISKEGFIAVPSKNLELQKNVNGNYCGYVHHRWIYNKENNNFVAYPKLNFIDNLNWDDVINKYVNYDELQFYWKDSFELKIVNDDYMGPSLNSVYSYFEGLKND